MQSFSIYRFGDYLFCYYEYTGDDYESEMAREAALPVSQQGQEMTGKQRELMTETSRAIEPEEILHEEFDVEPFAFLMQQE